MSNKQWLEQVSVVLALDISRSTFLSGHTALEAGGGLLTRFATLTLFSWVHSDLRETVPGKSGLICCSSTM